MKWPASWPHPGDCRRHRDCRWHGEPHAIGVLSIQPEGARQPFSEKTALTAVVQAPQASELLAEIRENPRQAVVSTVATDYLRCQGQLAQRLEMIVKLADFLRHRSKIALTTRREDIEEHIGCKGAIQFGDWAREKLDEYFQD